MTFAELLEQLAKEYILNVQSLQENLHIRDVALIDHRQTCYEDDILYFGYDNQLHNPEIIPLQCILVHAGSDSVPAGISGNIAYVEPAVLFSVFNDTQQLLDSSKTENLYEDLLALSRTTHSIDAVLDNASVRLGQCLVFCDMNFKIVSYSTSIPVIDKLWTENIRQGFCNYDFIRDVRALSAIANSGTTTSAIEVTCTESPFRKLSCKVFCRKVQVGFVLMIEGDNAFTSQHKDLLRIVCDAVGYTIDHYIPDLSEVVSVHQQVLYDFLIGARPTDILPRLAQIHFPDQMAALFLHSTKPARNRQHRKKISNELKALIPGTHVTYHENGIVAVIPVGDYNRFKTKVCSILRDYAEQEHIWIGISNVFSNIADFVRYYEQARAAYELGKKFRPDEFTYHYLDYQDYDMFSHISGESDLRTFVHPALEILKEYDEKNHAQLYETLHCYLENNCMIKDTAAKLFIHRNSLVYRLNRITELCQLDLEDTHTKFLLRLSYLIDNYCDIIKK